MKNKHFIIVFLLIVGLLSCKDKTPTFYVDKEVLRYTWFPEGSYWIYQEANTHGLFDSVHVVLSESEIVPDYGEGFQQDYYGNRIIIRGLAFGRQVNAWPPSKGTDVANVEVTEWHSDSSGQMLDYVFFQESRGRDTMISYPHVIISNRYDTITIGGNTYSDAIEVFTPPSKAEHTYLTIWAKDVGVLRRSMIDGTTWDLVRYRINR